MRAPPLFTIGYERSHIGELIATLEANEVVAVIDVREVAWSRRPEYAKAALRGELGPAGIDYHHLRHLGTPKPGRDVARAGDRETFLGVFERHLESEEARAEISVAAELATTERVCLFCYEREPERCHRTIVAGRIAGRTGQRVIPLLVGNAGTGGGDTTQGELFGRASSRRHR